VENSIVKIDPNEVTIIDRIDPNEVEIIPQQPAPETPKRPPASVKERMVQGFLDPIVGAGQIAEKIPGLVQARKFLTGSDTGMADVVRHGVGNYKGEAEYVAPEGVDWARMGGNVANPVTWLGGGAGVLRAAGQGAVQAGLAPVSPDANFLFEKAKQTGMGAAGGAILAKVLRGFTPTSEAQALMDRGIQPTFGQSKGGLANTVEQKLTSVPFVGDAINYARNRAQREFEAAAVKRAMGDGPEQAQTIPQQLQQLFTKERIPGTSVQVERSTRYAPTTLDEANDWAGRLYKETVPNLKPTGEAVAGVQQSVREAMQNPELIDQNKQVLSGIAQKYFANFGKMNGDEIKRLDSELGALARKYNAGDPQSKVLAQEIWKLQHAFRTGLEAGLSDADAIALRVANRSYRNLVPINKAASTRADEKITPRSLQKAMARQAGVDVSRMPPDGLVDSAVKVLPSNIPDSGSAGRVLLGGGVAGLAGSLPAYIGAGGAAYAGAYRPVQRAMVGNTAWQKALSPYDALFAAAAAAALRGQGQGNE
jgi:hypothetical protein